MILSATTSRGRGDRILIARWIVMLMATALLIRLFTLQVLRASSATTLAIERRQTVKAVPAQRGEVYISDAHGGQEVPIAMNQILATVFAVPDEIDDAESVAKELSVVLGEEEAELKDKLSRRGSQFVPLKKRVASPALDAFKRKKWKGVYSDEYPGRVYPEGELAAHLTGFARVDDDGITGQYGVEGAFNKELSGQEGWEHLLRDGSGRLIPKVGALNAQAQDGLTIVLTVDRSVQFTVCDGLKRAVEAQQAEGGSVVVMDPKTGEIRAMCNAPSFDPNAYASVEDLRRFNNPAVDDAYEPGSVMKVITMAAGIEEGVVTPATTYVDTGSVTIADRTIRNAALKVYGTQSMVGVLKESINTGAVFVAERLGRETLRGYLERLGFGKSTGLELPNEHSGNIQHLSNPGLIYAATASFGQGITVTVVQLARAVSALANGGLLVEPTIIKEFRAPGGVRIPRGLPSPRRVLSQKTSSLVAGMMVQVVEEGHSRHAGVAGYYVGGKTGTAQIAATDRLGYGTRQNHTFVGFAPVEDPRFVVVVRLVNPKALYAESTSVPLAGEIINYLLSYDQVPPTRLTDEQPSSL